MSTPRPSLRSGRGRGAVFCGLAITVAALALTTAVHAAPPPRTDPVIAAAVAKVSAARLKSNDLKLVSFGTRNTFSEKLGSQRGVFAARDWIAEQFREIAKESHGRMTVAFDTTFTRPTATACPGTSRSRA